MSRQRKKQGNQNPVVTVILSAVILVGVLLFIGYITGRTAHESEITISEGSLSISGQFGKSYPLAAITSIELVEGVPQLGRKINGAGLRSRSVYRGEYEVEGLGRARVFLFGQEGPYIKVQVGQETVLIMVSDKEKTMNVYGRILAVLAENQH